METKLSVTNALPPTNEHNVDNNQQPTMVFQTGGAQLNTFPQAMIQPSSPQVVYYPQYMGTQGDYPPQPLGTKVMYQAQPIPTQIAYPAQQMEAQIVYQPQPMGTQIMYQPQPMGTQIVYQPQPFGTQIAYQPQQMGTKPTNLPQKIINNPQIATGVPQYSPDATILKFTNQHYWVGIAFICIGIVTGLIDPLVPLLSLYPYSILPAALFMIISGATSLAGSKQRNRCLLVVSMIFDILASVNLIGGFITGIFLLCIPYYRFQTGFSIFNAIYCPILFCVVVWDSSIKCRDTCCGIRPPRVYPTNEIIVYTVQSAPAVVPQE